MNVWVIARKEILAKLIGSEFLLSFALISSLSVISVYTKLYDYKEQVSNYHVNVNTQMSELAQEESFFGLANRPINFFRTPQPLQILATGVNRELSDAYYILFLVREKLNTKSDFLASSLSGYVPVVDFVFVASVLFSLFAFLYTYNTVNKEVESGTLRLVLVCGASRSQILLGKMIGLLSVFSVALMSCFLLVVALLYLAAQVRLGTEELEAILLIFVITWLYVATCLLIGIFGSMVVRRTTTALVFLLLVWVTLFICLPSMLSTYAAEKSSASSHDVKEKIVRLQDQLSDRWLKKVDPAHNIYKKTKDWSQYIRLINQSDTDFIQENRKIAQEYYISVVLKQEEILKRVSLLSPSALFSHMACTLAATTAESELRYYTSLLDYITNHYAPYLFRKQLEEASQNGKAKRVDLADMPHFSYTVERMGLRINKILPFAAALLFYDIIFFLLSYLFFIKMHV